MRLEAEGNVLGWEVGSKQREYDEEKWVHSTHTSVLSPRLASWPPRKSCPKPLHRQSPNHLSELTLPFGLQYSYFIQVVLVAVKSNLFNTILF